MIQEVNTQDAKFVIKSFIFLIDHNINVSDALDLYAMIVLLKGRKLTNKMEQPKLIEHVKNVKQRLDLF